MPSIHPSEHPPLGWLVPCLAVNDIHESIDYYAALGFERLGGDPDAGWAALRSRANEIHLFQGHIEQDLLNLRGGDWDAIKAALDERGLEAQGGDGFAARTYLDPDGRPVFFDATDDEVRAYHSGRPLTLPIIGELHSGDGVDLGNLTVCLNCQSLSETRDFYAALAFEAGGGDADTGWLIMARPDHHPAAGKRVDSVYLSLFEGMIPEDLLNFRGGNVRAIADQLAGHGIDLGDGVTVGEDGGESLMLTDPDGRTVFFDTTPRERLYGSEGGPGGQ